MRPEMKGFEDILSGWPPPVLDPAGPYAASINVLTWVLIAMGIVVTLVVAVCLGLALFGGPRIRKALGDDRLVWIGGFAFPVVVLTALLIYGLVLTRDISRPPGADEMRVRVTGEMWWWRVAYLDGAGREAVHDANEVHIPVGRPVIIELRSADVIHSFWVPRLGGKVDMIPGRTNYLRLRADKPGVYAGQCAEFCGGPHALMGFRVVAHEPGDFAAWRARRATPVAAPATGDEARGAEVFRTSGCGACHRIAGTSADGLAAPDLTHVGSRMSLGAGILPNSHQNRMRWIADSQAIKPGNRMPPYGVLSPRDLAAVSAYLGARR